MNENTKQSSKQFTKKQHYIPQMMLKRFMNTQVPIRKPIIYQYDKEKDIERQIPKVADICFEKNLYEIRNENDIISDEERNLIEDSFSRLESTWNVIIKKIEEKQDISKEERDMLALLLVLQLIRTPEVMKITKEWLNNACTEINKSLTQNEVDKYSKLASFVWETVKPETNWFLYKTLDVFLTNKNIIIFHTKNDFVVNSNRPVMLLINSKSENIQNCQLLLPIAKNYCIGLTNEKNILHEELNEEATKFINGHFFKNDGQYIYASKSIKNRIKDLEKNMFYKI